MSDIARDEPLRDEETPDAAFVGESAGGEAVSSELERLREESAQRLAAWQRAQADFENLKRRSAQDVRDRVERSQRAIFDSLVDLADDFRRALEAETGGADDLRAGMGLIEQKLIGLLERNGVHPIAAVGVAFDPNFHESMGELPGPKDEVVAELRRGWLIGERVLRASMVMVGAGQQDESGATSAEQRGAEQQDAERAASGESHGGAAEGAEPCRE